MLYVTDTHALAWYLSGSAQLGDKARQAFDETVIGESATLIPAIVLAEIIRMAEKKKAPSANEVWAVLEQIPTFQFTSLSPRIAMKIQELADLPDIHDRLIVAEAIESKAALITYDKAITASGFVKVVW